MKSSYWAHSAGLTLLTSTYTVPAPQVSYELHMVSGAIAAHGHQAQSPEPKPWTLNMPPMNQRMYSPLKNDYAEKSERNHLHGIFPWTTTRDRFQVDECSFYQSSHKARITVEEYIGVSSYPTFCNLQLLTCNYYLGFWVTREKKGINFYFIIMVPFSEKSIKTWYSKAQLLSTATTTTIRHQRA